ncbi:MAG: hypothetical protein HYZ81_16260 [Nitrospinae bacterium]|nr:hypothetical protein [Nitrospinota bacterium]
MAVQIAWQALPEGYTELWLVERGQPCYKLFALAPKELERSRTLVQRWAEQADSLPEFLEMMHLEGLIDLEMLRRRLEEHIPLYRMWAKLREFCRLAGDIGEVPMHQIIVGDAEDLVPENAVWLPKNRVAEATAAWLSFEAGADVALNSSSLAAVLAELGCLAGQRLGLRWDAAMHLGDWLCGLITGWLLTHGNEEQLWQLESIAAQAAAGGLQHIGPACYNPAVWDVYRPAIAAVVQALREGVS